jgi:hypothetical protein
MNGPGSASKCLDPCEREAELLAALGRGFLGRELEDHVRECAACGELHLVAGALLDDRAAAVAEAPVPSAGTMWWRMRMRHRRDAQALARRSLLVGQALSLAVAIALLAWLFGGEVVQGARGVFAAVRVSTPLLLAMVTLLVLAPIGGWVAIRGK